MQLTSLSLFLSTPSDVQEERSIVHRVVAYLDEEVARRLGFALRLISSDTVLPDAGPPQEVINQQVTDYDIYVGIMWSRFGTPTAEAGSGTEEEFLRALRRHEVDQSPSRVLFYLCDRSIPFPRTDDDLAQLAAVTRFRATALRSALVSFYRRGSVRYVWLVFALCSPFFWALVHVLDAHCVERVFDRPWMGVITSGLSSLVVLLLVPFAFPFHDGERGHRQRRRDFELIIAGAAQPQVMPEFTRLI